MQENIKNQDSLNTESSSVKSKQNLCDCANLNVINVAQTNTNRKELLVCENVSFGYDNNLVLSNVNFSVKEGDFVIFIGPNGGGKSTLAKILLGLLKPSSGKILYPNKEIFHKKSIIGYTPQDTSINRHFPISALDVVLMGFLERKILGYKISKNELNEAMAIMENLKIAHLAKKKLSELSGGQRQKVLIARALCGNPKLIIFDEPTSNIDMPTQKKIYELLRQINANHTIIVITHDMSILMECASNILFVNNEVVGHKLTQNLRFDGHFCEVEAINNYINLCS